MLLTELVSLKFVHDRVEPPGRRMVEGPLLRLPILHFTTLFVSDVGQR